MFVTDLVGDNSTIIMTFMEKDQTKEIREWLEAWCKEHISSEWSLHCGAVVDELSQMQISLKECKRQMNRKKEEVLEVGNIRKEEEHYEILKEDILAYLDKNYTDPELTQTVVADHFRVSVYTMSRLLKKQFDIGFVDYINGKRLELAKQLLKTTEIPVREIAIEVGFSDANYFSRIFKKYTGVSPSKYRED
jgi:YesN/AraC family two-component response regulator